MQIKDKKHKLCCSVKQCREKALTKKNSQVSNRIIYLWVFTKTEQWMEMCVFCYFSFFVFLMIIYTAAALYALVFYICQNKLSLNILYCVTFLMNNKWVDRSGRFLLIFIIYDYANIWWHNIYGKQSRTSKQGEFLFFFFLFYSHNFMFYDYEYGAFQKDNFIYIDQKHMCYIRQ